MLNLSWNKDIKDWYYLQKKLIYCRSLFLKKNHLMLENATIILINMKEKRITTALISCIIKTCWMRSFRKWMNWHFDRFYRRTKNSLKIRVQSDCCWRIDKLSLHTGRTGKNPSSENFWWYPGSMGNAGDLKEMEQYEIPAIDWWW